MDRADVVIIGAGAAGLMCAIAAGRRGRSVLVLEGSNKIGKKILMSGGGRCNFTNIHADASHFVGNNPHFCKSALSQYTQWDFIAMVEQCGIAYHEKTLGQLFCDDSSKDIVEMLGRECNDVAVTIKTHSADLSIEKASSNSHDRYSVHCSHGTFRCQSLVIACGGLSIPKMGATDFGYRVARQFDLQLVETRAALVPFTVTGTLHDLCVRLAGVSCSVSVQVADTRFSEDMLFTHRGLSGPVMLQASSYWRPGGVILIDLLPGTDLRQQLLTDKRDNPKALLRNKLTSRLPKALVAELQNLLWPTLAMRPLGEIRDEQLSEIAGLLHAWKIKPAATEGYRTAEVTMGGVNTDELSSKTMETVKHPGLYFIGEVVDVTGHLGGFNFQWAWSSGQAAGRVA